MRENDGISALPDFSPCPCGRSNMPWEENIQCTLAFRRYSRNLIRMYSSHVWHVSTHVQTNARVHLAWEVRRMNARRKNVASLFWEKKSFYPRTTFQSCLFHTSQVRYFSFYKKLSSGDHVIIFSRRSSRLAKAKRMGDSTSSRFNLQL